MSLLHRIIAAIRSDHAQQAIGEFAPAMPAANYLTAEVALVDRPVVEPEEDWQAHETAPLLRQNGRYVDYEEEVSMSQSANAQAVIFEKTQTDLKSLFPKLSLR